MGHDEALVYYAQQSALTDPGMYAALYDDLPRDIPALARAIQGLLIPPWVVGWYGLRPEEVEFLGPDGYGLRPVAALLGRIAERDDAPLGQPRPPRLRLAANCRNFGTLLVSMLRHHGIPARLRIGFDSYLEPSLRYDHRIAEYWDAPSRRWVLADPMTDELLRQRWGVGFDPLDISPADGWYPSSEVWRRCRAGEWDAEAFGDSITDRGMPPIRYALLHDFAALNKIELLGCDDWGDLIVKPEAALSGAELALLDRIAALTLHPDEQLPALREHFAAVAYGQAVRSHLAVCRRREEKSLRNGGGAETGG